MDLIRALLLHLEASTPVATDSTYGFEPKELASQFAVDTEALIYHVVLLYEAGLIDGWASRGQSRTSGKSHVLENNAVHYVAARHLTWAGHEFLETIRDEEIWKKTKGVATQVGSFGIETLKELGIGFIKKKIKDHTGVEI